MTGFKRAVKSRSKLRLALIGPSGSGKTYTALAIAAGLGKRVAVIDTEHGSASKYADLFEFDVLELSSYSPERYVEALKAAAAAGYEVVVIDSLSHAWMGKDGALELVDRAAARSKSGNSFGAWREVTPQHNSMVEAIITSPCHVICTMRSKTEYVQDRDERGKTVIRKVGLQPVQRDGMEYEFDVVGDIDHEHKLIVTKSRIPALSDAVISKPGAELAAQLRDWLNAGAPDDSTNAVGLPPFAEPKPDGLVSIGQLNLIRELFAASGLRHGYGEQMRARYNVASSTDLTRAQADEVIAELRGVIENKERNQ